MIGKDGEQLGILDTRKAIDLAQGLGLDLVAMSITSDPPVCRIMDYGKYKYQQKKKAQEAKKNQVIVEVKEIQLRPKTDLHDIDHKAKSVIGFLEEGDKAKVSVFFRGREMEHVHMGWDTLREFAVKLNDKAILETPPRLEGKRLSCIFAPIPKGKKMNPGHLVESMPRTPPPRRNSGAPYGGGYHAPSQQPQAQPAAVAPTQSSSDGAEKA